FIKKGLTTYQVAGMLGNAQAESGMDPAAEQVVGNINLGGKGLFQWDDRKFNLYTFANKRRKSWTDPQVQFEFTWQEFQTTEATAFSKLKASKNVTDAALRSEEHTSELQSRFDLVCRLLLEKKKKRNKKYSTI